ncbi:MAG: S9 family peptidase [Kangiellaceae bacterium]|nr:S9 family peptidase [Kangiellaceae bacterium]
MAQTLPYGSWSSTLTAEKLADKGIRYGHMMADNGYVYWLESRAKEQGRGVIVKSNSKGNRVDLLPATVSVRTKVHEYGSGDFIAFNSSVYFSDADNQCVYHFDGELSQLTSVGINCEYRYADYTITPNQQFLICVRETHENNQVVNELIAIDLFQKYTSNGNSHIRVLHTGFDFYSAPRLTKNAHRLSWTCWNHPDMPWDASELWVADFHRDGSLDAAHRITGGNPANILREEKGFAEQQRSVSQPLWSEDGVLHFISDASGWTNLYSCRDGLLNALAPIDREFGIPQWVLGTSTYVLHGHHVIAAYFQNGQQQLCRIDVNTGQTEQLVLPFRDFGEHMLSDGQYLYFRASGPAIPEAIYAYDLEDDTYQQLSLASEFPIAIDEISIPQTIEFVSKNSRKSHAFYYPPKNRAFSPPKGNLPPLIVMSHGGPTAATSNSLDASIQFWTHRGFAVVDVNYGGSTGFGKKYRNSLLRQWGVVDVEDCIAAAEYLVEQKLADGNALLIRGGSAGGYTTLCALTYFDVFAAGMSRYGVADLESLASDSHKFESRYLDSVVGPYPKEKQLYMERSPIHSTDKLSCPILLLQGEDDKVVPPNQAEMMVDALKAKKIPFAYQLYPGEGHGFRKSSTIVSALNSELYFYRTILQIEDSENIDKIEIQNIENSMIKKSTYKNE